MSRKNRKIEQALARAVRNETPEQLQALLCARQKRKAEHTMTVQNIPTPKKRPLIKYAAIAAVFVLLLGAGGFYLGYRNQALAVISTIGIDVNPSVELQVNRQNKVVQAHAYNDDATQILADMDLKGVDVTVAVNAVIGSMVRNGYLGETNNTVLLSFSGADNEALREMLITDVDQTLQQQSISGAVFSQTVSTSEETQQIAEQYHISTGKAEWIRALAASNPAWSVDTLAGCSITDLALLSTGSQNQSGPVDANQGAVSDKQYIGAEKAQQIALEQVPGGQVIGIEMDLEHGQMTYEVKLLLNQVEYEYKIDAATGGVIAWEQDSGHAATDNVICLDKAKELVLNKLPGGQITELKLDSEKGIAVYEGEVWKDSVEYEFKLHAVTGEFLQWEPHQNPSQNTNSQNFIGTEKAKQLVLQKVPNGQITELKLDDAYSSLPVYEGEVWENQVEYEFEINAITGEFVKWDTENHGTSGNSTGTAAGQASISYEEAKQIALEKVPGAQLKKLELDYDDGLLIYEGELWKDRMEYEFEIDATTGKILKWESEWDD